MNKMTDEILNNTIIYNDLHNKNNKKQKGQFFTPEIISDFMAARAAQAAKHLSILEPGAGNALLTASVIKYCIDNDLCRSFSIKLVENDTEIIPVLRMNVDIIKNYVMSHNGTIDVIISVGQKFKQKKLKNVQKITNFII